MPRVVRSLCLLVAPALLAGCLQRVAWLPDGKRLAYIRDGVIWHSDLEGTQRRLADAPAPLDPEISVGPGGWLAATGRLTTGGYRLVVLDPTGATRFAAELAADAPHALLATGCWSPNGRFLAVSAGRAVYLADLQAGTGRTIADAGVAARFTGAGDLVTLKDTQGTWALALHEGTGKAIAAKPWKSPRDLVGATPVWLTDDASAAWWRGRRQDRETMMLSGADGRPVASSDRTAVAAGPDSRSFVTDAGGYAVVRAAGPALNLNPVYNRLLRMDLNWHLADPGAAAGAYDPEALLKSCAPAFSPDGTRVAILTPRMLAVATLSTNEVTALAKW